MCRFALYLGQPILVGSLVTEPTNSIIHQSFHSHEREEPLNGDGFGLAWYAPAERPEPVVFKDVTPAWNNVNLLNLAPVTRTSCLFAHVRAASPGLPVSQLNCHPFAYGRFAFMHNGFVEGFDRIVRPLRERLSDEAYHHVRGSTDSEHVFALFADAYRKSEASSGAERMVRAVVDAISTVEDLRSAAGLDGRSTLNLAVTDGRCAVVSRFVSGGGEGANSLYVNTGSAYLCENGLCRMRGYGEGDEAVVVASEPLSDDPGWRRVEVNHLVVVGEDLSVAQRPIYTHGHA